MLLTGRKALPRGCYHAMPLYSRRIGRRRVSHGTVQRTEACSNVAEMMRDGRKAWQAFLVLFTEGFACMLAVPR